MSSAPKADRQQRSRPHQPPARHRTTSHPSQEGNQRGARGEEPPGAACSAGDNGQRRRLPPDIRPETGGQRAENGVLQDILQVWRRSVVITSVIVTVWHADDGQTCTAAAPSQRGGGVVCNSAGGNVGDPVGNSSPHLNVPFPMFQNPIPTPTLEPSPKMDASYT